MIRVGDRVRLSRDLSKQVKRYWEEREVFSGEVYIVEKCVKVPSGVLCFLKGTGHCLYEEELEDVFLSNLDKILT